MQEIETIRTILTNKDGVNSWDIEKALTSLNQLEAKLNKEIDVQKVAKFTREEIYDIFMYEIEKSTVRAGVDRIKNVIDALIEAGILTVKE